MKNRLGHFLWGSFLIGACGSSASSVTAAPILFSGVSSDGHAVSGSAEFTLNASADTIQVKLTNTTTTTLDAGETLTGLDFDLGGLTPALVSATAIQRTVDANGTFSDSPTPQTISWSLASLGGGSFQLNFTPNAEDGVIGPPTAGNYSGANGSIKGNAGHNPFAAQVAEFVLNVPNLEANAAVTATMFRFGTTLDPAIGITTPEPASLSSMAMAGVVIALRRRRRRDVQQRTAVSRDRTLRQRFALTPPRTQPLRRRGRS